MVNNEIWLDSQATVSMIPEQDIYLGTFAAGAIASASNGQRTIPLGTDFTAHFSLVADLYRGCMLDIYILVTCWKYFRFPYNYNGRYSN